jgi:hypothetical protein
VDELQYRSDLAIEGNNFGLRLPTVSAFVLSLARQRHLDETVPCEPVPRIVKRRWVVRSGLKVAEK